MNLIFKKPITTTTGEKRTLQYTIDTKQMKIVNVMGVDFCANDEFDCIEFPSSFTLPKPPNFGKSEYKVTSIGPNVMSSKSNKELFLDETNELLSHKIKTIKINDGIQKLDEDSFIDSKIDVFELSESCVSIGVFAFTRSTIKSITINHPMECIETGAFSKCSNLTSVKILAPCNSIQYYAFSYCPLLSSVELNDNVQIVGEGIFRNCSSLKTFHWPAFCNTIPENCFENCSNLSEIDIVNETLTVYDEFKNTAIINLDFSKVGRLDIIETIISDNVSKNIILPFYGYVKYLDMAIPF